MYQPIIALIADVVSIVCHVSGKRKKTLPHAKKMMGRGMETRPAVRRSEVRRHQQTAGA